MLITIGGDNNIALDTNSLIYCPINLSNLFWLGRVLTCVLIGSYLLINAERIFTPYITIQ